MEALRSHTPKGTLARDKILRVAERLFAARGFHGTSLREVAQAARIPLATLVYHFARKEKLYASVLAAIAEDLEARLGRALAPVEGPWPDRLDALVRSLVTWARDAPGRVNLLSRELLDNPARVARASKLPLAPVLLRLASFVEEGVRAGAFRPVAPETSVLHLVGAVSYVVAATPTVGRIVGASRAAALTTAYEHEAIRFARSVFLDPRAKEGPDGEQPTDRTRRARAHAPRV